MSCRFGWGFLEDHLQEPLPLSPGEVPPFDVEPDRQFLALGVTEVAHDPEGILSQPEFLNRLPPLMPVDEDVIGGNQDGLEDASLPDRVPELGVFLGR